MNEWKEYKLGEIADITPGFAFKSKDFGQAGELVVKIKDIAPPYIDLSNADRVDLSPYDKNKLSKYLLYEGDYVVAMTGATIGKVGKLKTDKSAYLNQRVAKIKAKEGVCDGFVYFSICGDDFQAFIQNNIDSNSAQENISASSIGRFPILLPPFPEQRRIASILSSLDDKIDLLHRENATLEQMAETLFRQWFVEEAKEEWEEGTVAAFAQHCKESINPQKHPNSIFLHYSIPAFDGGKNPTVETGENIQSNKYLVPSNCILFSKLNPHKDKRVWLMLNNVPDNAICSTEFQIVKPIKPEYLYFLYGWLMNKENYDEIASGVGGTSGSHQRIDPKSIFSFACPNVDSETIRNYNNKVEPLFYKIRNNQKQIQTLIQTRDGLLPKLMSGEVKIESRK